MSIIYTTLALLIAFIITLGLSVAWVLQLPKRQEIFKFKEKENE